MKWNMYRLQMRTLIMSMLLMMVLTCFSALPVAQAEDVSVEITSFMRRNVTEDGQIRCSELMEAVLTGYEGNPYELTYEWKNVSCNANLYLYNSYNMDGIDNGAGEIEKIGIGKTAGGKGFAWAAVRSKNAQNYRGEISVTVKDANGKKVASDTYTNFKNPDLDADLEGIAFGMFIDEKVNVKDLLGRSAIVHITCQGAKVSSGSIAQGQNVASLSYSGGDYYVTGKNKGETSASITVSKGSCSFHTNQQATVTTPIYVFQKPQTTTTTTTLTLTVLDERCEYFIGSIQGKRDGDKVVFTGLTPNTEYQVTVRGEYRDTDETVKYAYAYVKDTTKPVYTATVNLYLDGVRMDAADILGTDIDLYLYDESKPSSGYIPMTKTDTGVYAAGVENGNYHVYRADGADYLLMSDAVLTVSNANREMNLRYYSVQYNCNGGSFADDQETVTYVYSAGSAVSAVKQTPQREGYSFTGWQYGGKTYQPGDAITPSISSAVVLLAQWEKSVNVTINVTLDHQGGDGYDTMADKDEVSVYLLEKESSDQGYLETSDELHFTLEQVRDEDGYAKAYQYSADHIEGEPKDSTHVSVTTYTATAPTYTNMSGSSSFDVKVQKSRYDVESMTRERDSSGNWVVNVRLKFNPSNFDLEYTVQMDKSVPKDLYPYAVVYKVAFWAGEERGWEIITQMEGDKGGDLVLIDPDTGKGSGSYPVWKYESDNATPYGYRIVLTGFVYDEDTITLPVPKNVVSAEYTDGSYTATMSGVTDGRKYGNDFNGAYFDDESQKGTLDAVITLKAHDVIFNAMGGKVNDQAEQTVKDQYYIPAFSGYQPVRNEHQFLGWYKDAAYTTPASANELLTSSVTLYARWDRVLTGKVTVEGTYQQNGSTIDVWKRDRAKRVNVLLQEMIGSNPQTIRIQTMEVNWPEGEDTGAGEYKFTGLSPERTYRVAFEVVNYTAKYQNEKTVSSAYNDDDYIAIYENKPDETFVNGLMSFTPASYNQPVTVDATRIGAGFRPGNVLVEVHYCETGSGDSMQVISQHTAEPYGIPMQMNADTGRPDQTYTQSVWQNVWDGGLYDYQAKVTKIDNNKNLDGLPMTIRYGNVSRWSPANGQPTATLEAILVPNTYSIIYHLGDGSEDVQDENGHTWSFETEVTYAPERKGYTFGGWYNNAECAGNPVTKIEAKHADDTELYAKWTPRSDLKLTVYYRDKDDDKEILEPKVLNNMTLGTNVDIDTQVVDIAGYQYVSASPESVTIAPDNNVLTLYYEKKDIQYTVKYFYNDVEDTTCAETASAKYKSEVTAYTEKLKANYVLDRVENLPLVIDSDSAKNIINVYYATDVFCDSDETDDPDDVDGETGGDGIPDKYQALVEFKVENGSWQGTADATSVKRVYTLWHKAENGVWMAVSPAPTLGTLPVAQPDEGYIAESGKWIDVITENTRVEKSVVYTFIYGELETYTITVNVVNGMAMCGSDSVANESFLVQHGGSAKITFSGNSGFALDTVTVDGTAAVLADDSSYTFNDVVNNHVIRVVYEEDVLCDSDETDEPDDVDGETGGDGIPDKYQKKIVFKVVNGTWADGKTEDSLAIVTLKKDGVWAADGEAALAIPTGMKANKDFKDGAWDAVKLNGEDVTTLTVKGADPVEQVFTHTFQRSLIDFDAMAAYQVVHWLQQTDGTYAEVEREFPLYAQVGTEVTAAEKDYGEHYALKDELPKGTVIDPRPQTEGAEPNLLTLNVYYDLDRHTVEYDFNGGAGASGVDYSPKTYICGTGEQVKAIPLNHGYLFKGWQDQDGNRHQAGAQFVVEKDYVFTAVWEKQTGLSYTVNYLDEDSGSVLHPSKTESGKTYQDSVLSQNEVIQIDNYCFVRADKDELTIDAFVSNNVINLYYAKDVLRDSDETNDPDDVDGETGGDGVPDKYQKKIVFKVVNGTWADGKTEDSLAVVTLKKDGAWAADGEAALAVPTGMKANKDFKNGAWDAVKLNGEDVTTLTVKGADPVEQVFTHTFQRSMVDFDAMAAYQVVHWLQQTDGTYVEAEREFPLYAQVGTEVTAAEKDYGEHYALKDELPKGTVIDPRPQTEGAEPNLLTLNVYYDLDRHTVKYNLNGGTGASDVDYSPKTYICGTGEQVKADPWYHGHLFKGWQDQDGNVHQAGEDFVVDKDYVFTAVWVEFILPQTGDTTNLILWIGMMAGSGLLLAICSKRNRARKA